MICYLLEISLILCVSGAEAVARSLFAIYLFVLFHSSGAHVSPFA